jgi:hypothetical protein
MPTAYRAGYRVLPYLDDFLVCPAKAGRVATRRDCGRAAREISKLLGTLGLTQHLTKREWSGSTRVEHLGCIVDTKLMRFFIAPREIVRVQEMARSLLRQQRKAVVGFLEKDCVRSAVSVFRCRCKCLTIASIPAVSTTICLQGVSIPGVPHGMAHAAA